ncbi:SusC/RagA family TonB-linked outer membrane protein [Bacteroides sedimenti]|uniref:SusC/RagA family TonB-linked outer membrane protein n=1 Tax=Bacteroides sedimenti TaxID=2136147 RepID=UPI003340DA5F
MNFNKTKTPLPSEQGRTNQKKLKLMAYIVLLLLSILSQPCLAQKNDSPKTRISLDMKNVSVKEVLSSIESKSKYYFTYNLNSVNVNRKTTIRVKDKEVTEILSIIFAGENVKYKVNDKHIVLFLSENQENNSRPGKTSSTRKITGKVKDEQGEPIIGANVLVEGSSNGTITDTNGDFSIDVKENDMVRVSFIGYEQQKVKVGTNSFLAVTLRENFQKVEEVVVTAMGIQRKAKSLTYATQKMDNEELMRVQDANFINSLQGKAAGLSITPNVGGAGGASKILLRGSRSIIGNNSPLIVVDGIPMSNNVKGQQGFNASLDYGNNTEGSDALSSINPDDIENINILKGANAAALYGSAAANGVIMVTTKKGKEGTMNINVTSNATFERPMILPEFQNEYGLNKKGSDSWGKRISDLTTNDLETFAAAGKHLLNKVGNDLNDFYRTGNTFNNSISLSGGTSTMRSYFSYANTTANGMLRNNTFGRHIFTFRQNYVLLNKKLNIDLALNYVNQQTKNRPGGGEVLNPIFHAYTAPRNADMSYYKNNYRIENAKWMSNSYTYYEKQPDGSFKLVTDKKTELKGTKQNWLINDAKNNNPYWIMNMLSKIDKQDRAYGYISGNYEIIKGLNAQGRFSMDRSRSETTDQRAATTYNEVTMMDRGIYGQWLTNSNEFYLDGMLSYNNSFKDFSVSATSGATAHRIKTESQSMYEQAMMYDYLMKNELHTINIFDPRAGSGSSRTYNKTSNWDQGLFITGQVGYKDAIYLEGSYRQDWYRAFAQFKDRGVPDNYGYYSFGANALVHNLVKMPQFITYLKLRTSYSEVGNSIPNLIFAEVGVNPITGSTIPSPYSYFKNPVPEVSRSFEAGFDASFFSNALNWDLTFYNTLLDRAYLIIDEGGYSKPVNTGVIRNRGIETTLSYAMNITKNFLWKTGVNFSYNANKILKTYIDEDGKEGLIPQYLDFTRKYQLRYKKGGQYGDMYATDFLRDENGKIKLTEADGKPILNPIKYSTYVGNMNPKFQLGWNNTFTYKNFSLYFLIDGKIGGKAVSFTEAKLDYLGLSKRTGEARNLQAKSGLTYTNIDGDTYPAMKLADGQITPIELYYQTIGGDIVATQYVYDATNFRLREMSLGYTFKKVFGPIKSLSLSLIGRNLFFLYNKAPMDPETSLSTQNSLGSVDIFNLPTTRSLGFSATLSF